MKADMSWGMMIGIAIGLGMDAFAVAIATGVKLCRTDRWQTLRMSGAFGFFQMIMPLIGWKSATLFAEQLKSMDHWIAFGLLSAVGLHMISESFHKNREDEKQQDPTRGWLLMTLAIATSIDALAVGISFSLLQVSVWLPAIVIGVVAAGMTILGLKLGCRFGMMLGKRMELLGGVILLGIGVKILFEHLFTK